MQSIRFLLILGCLLGVSLLVAQVTGQRVHRSRQRTLALQLSTNTNIPSPIPLQVRYQEILSDGVLPAKRISTSRLVVVDPDGSEGTFEDQYTHEGKLYFSHSHFKLKGGISADIDNTLKIFTAYRMPEPDFEDRRRQLAKWDPASRCTVTFDQQNRRADPSSASQILGYEALVFPTETKDTRITHWVAPSLGCLVLRRYAEFAGPAGDWKESSDLIATEIRLEAPAKSLLAMPTGFTPATPSETYRREAQYWGKTPSAEELHQFEKFDAQYRANQFVPAQ